jgi:hypothetical protein
VSAQERPRTLSADDFTPAPWQASFFQGKHLALPLDGGLSAY